jgi:hypothetical protein
LEVDNRRTDLLALVHQKSTTDKTSCGAGHAIGNTVVFLGRFFLVALFFAVVFTGRWSTVASLAISTAASVSARGPAVSGFTIWSLPRLLTGHLIHVEPAAVLLYPPSNPGAWQRWAFWLWRATSVVVAALFDIFRLLASRAELFNDFFDEIHTVRKVKGKKK